MHVVVYPATLIGLVIGGVAPLVGEGGSRRTGDDLFGQVMVASTQAIVVVVEGVVLPHPGGVGVGGALVGGADGVERHHLTGGVEVAVVAIAGGGEILPGILRDRLAQERPACAVAPVDILFVEAACRVVADVAFQRVQAVGGGVVVGGQVACRAGDVDPVEATVFLMVIVQEVGVRFVGGRMRQPHIGDAVRIRAGSRTGPGAFDQAIGVVGGGGAYSTAIAARGGDGGDHLGAPGLILRPGVVPCTASNGPTEQGIIAI